MTAPIPTPETPYGRAIAASKKARWAIDADVLRDRRLHAHEKYLPDALSLVKALPFLSPSEQRLLSQVQGRTYANVFGLVERYINAKVLELAGTHVLGDQLALEALVRFSDEELKHQELFRRVEALAASELPPGYSFAPDPDDVARAVLGKSTWAVLALTLHIELFTQVHYKKSIDADPELSPLYKDVFRFHFMEEAQHAVLDEHEWRREDARLDEGERSRAVTDFIDLVRAVDGIISAQAALDADYFVASLPRAVSPTERERIEQTLLEAYRFQYIVSGVKETRFVAVLSELVSANDLRRVQSSLAPLL
jgi:hypothetical protein